MNVSSHRFFFSCLGDNIVRMPVIEDSKCLLWNKTQVTIMKINIHSGAILNLIIIIRSNRNISWQEFFPLLTIFSALVLLWILEIRTLTSALWRSKKASSFMYLFAYSKYCFRESVCSIFAQAIFLWVIVEVAHKTFTNNLTNLG